MILFQGQKDLTITGQTFTEGVRIQRCTNVTIERCEFAGSGLDIRDMCRGITVRRNRFHDGYTGIAGPGRVDASYQSSGITIEDNVIEWMRSDGIQFGDWNDVVIRGNTIREIHDPAGLIHNDCIQFTGGTTGALIEKNTLHASNAQLLFVQDAIRPIANVTIQRNLLSSCGAVACQVQGVAGLVMRENVIDSEHGDGDVWIRKGLHGFVPTDAKVERNLTRTPIRVWDGVGALTSANQLLAA